MARTHSFKHREAKEKLINEVSLVIKNGVGVPVAAKKAGIGYHELSEILRMDSAVSISKLEEIGNAVGLKLVMKWER